MKKYQPSNGTEGEIFMDQFCCKCIKFPESPDAINQCQILAKTFYLRVTDKDYPHQWQYKDDTPVCTAFKDRVEFNKERSLKRKPKIKQIQEDDLFGEMK